MPNPPTSGTPEYDEWAAEDKGPVILAISWLFIAVATLFIFARLYVRLGILKQLRSDDYYCVLALICGYISTAATTVAVGFGNGRHFTLLSTREQERVSMWTTAAFLPGVMCFGLPKLAVVALLTRLMNPSKLHRCFLWFIVIWCQLTLVATIGTLLGQCTPTESIWNFDMKRTCVDPDIIINFSLYAGAYSAFVDIYLAIYPSVVLFKLKLTIRKKIGLSIALGIGCVSGVIAVYKTTRIPDGLGSPDFSYDSSDLVLWTIIEGATLIIACTIPVLAPLKDVIFKSGKGSQSSSNNKETDNSSSNALFINGSHSQSSSSHC